MREIRVGKLTLNVGAGKDANVLEKGLRLLKNITGIEPIKTFTRKRIPTWGLRPGLPIGCKITIRGKAAKELILKLISARDNKLSQSHFDNNGNISFGVLEYIDIPGVTYDPKIGMMGLQVCITLERPGFRIKRRKLKNKISSTHLINHDDSIKFMKDNFKIQINEELEQEESR